MRSGRVLVASLLLALSAHAAEPTEEQQEQARKLFEQGKEAISTGRFAEASEMFQRSNDLVPKASAAFNLAVALRGMGRPKESRDVLVRLLRGDFGKLPEDRRQQAEQLADEARRDVCTLSVVARGAARIELRVDGARIGDLRESEALRIEVNPGERVVTFTAKLRDPVERRIVLAPGKAASLEADLPLSRAARRAKLVVLAKDPSHEVEIVGVGRGRGRFERRLDPGNYRVRVISPNGTRETRVSLEPATEHRVELEPPQRGLLSSPWFWTAAGAVAIGAAVGGYFLLRDREREPVSDPEFSVVQTLRTDAIGGCAGCR
jgi:hypothetical protein